MVFTSSDDSSIRVWNVRTGVWQLMVHRHKSGVQSVAVSGTKDLLATAGLDGHVTLRCFRNDNLIWITGSNHFQILE